MPVLLFCRCGSDRVDIRIWNGERAQIHCLSCSHHAWLDGFSISEFDPNKLLTSALVDQARKHRKRPPEQTRQLEEKRRNG